MHNHGHNPGPMYGRPPDMPGGPAPMGGPSGYGPGPGMGGPIGAPPGLSPMATSPQAGPPPRPRGASKALPIVVAAGLAIGVFGGLIIMNGAGGEAAAADEAPATAAGDDSKLAVAKEADAGTDKVVAQADAAPVPDAAQVAATSGDAGVSVDAASADTDTKVGTADTTGNERTGSSRRTGSTRRSDDRGSSSDPSDSTGRSGRRGDQDGALTPSAFADSSADAVAASATLTFKVSPPSVPGLAVTVNGRPASGLSATVALGGKAKKVKVVAKARGYRTWGRSYTVRRDQVIRIRLRRPKTDNAPGGLIDL